MSVQFIASRRIGKPVTWYVYAWRGGPLILKQVSPRKPSLGRAEHAAIAAALQDDRAPRPASLRETLRKWCPNDPRAVGSPDWDKLAANTKRVWRPHIDAIEERWGETPLALWSEPRMVSKVVKWRDERRDTPRTADIGVTVLKHFLEFARLRGQVAVNVAERIPRLYAGADRADIIWTDDDVRLFEAKAIELGLPQMIDLLRLAAVTGLRREDLVTLTWAQIETRAIVKKALKVSRRKRRRVVIPKTPQLETVLLDLRDRHRLEGVETVLVNSKGRSWTVNSIGNSFGRIRDAAGIVHVDEDGTRVRSKRLHDVRGTFCTMLMVEWELTDQEIAEVVGWSPETVGQIRKVYVDHERVVVALSDRIAAKQIAKLSASV